MTVIDYDHLETIAYQRSLTDYDHLETIAYQG